MIVTVAACAYAAVCPLCRRSSRSVHSRYERRLRDLPSHGVAVQLKLRVRRFRCRTAGCPRKIFVERLPRVALPYGRQTARFSETLRILGYALGGEAGAELAQRLGIEASPDTILRRLKTEGAASSAVRAVGVDDWAWRKGHRYGTILIDLEKRCVIDLLPDRSGAGFREWLEGHAEVRIVSRDRAGVYAQACRQGAPAAVQVADRFHLIMNLTAAVEKALQPRSRQLRYQSGFEESGFRENGRGSDRAGENDSFSAEQGSSERRAAPSRSKQLAEQRRRRRLERYEQAVELNRHGFSQKAIASQLGLDRKTVRRWLRSDGFPERKTAERPSRLTRFQPYLERRWREDGHNGAQLWREIQRQGYRGGRGMVAQLVAKWRREGIQAAPKSLTTAAAKTMSPRRAAILVTRRAESLRPEEERLIVNLSESCPDLLRVRAMAEGFRTALESGQPPLLKAWMKDVQNDAFPSIARFAGGLNRDWSAVEAAVTLPWSNGPVEGHVNRLKLIKRQMYGRAGFELLRSRVLPYRPVFLPARAP